MKLSREVCRLCKGTTTAVLNRGWFDSDELRWRAGYVLCPGVDFPIPGVGRAGHTTACVPSWCPYAAEHVVSRCL